MPLTYSLHHIVHVIYNPTYSHSKIKYNYVQVVY